MQTALRHDAERPNWPPPQKRLAAEQRQDLAQWLKKKYQAGASIRALVKETGRSYGNVHRLLSEADVTFRGRGGAKPAFGRRYREQRRPGRGLTGAKRTELAAKLKREYERHKTIGALAEKHRLPYCLVRNLLHESGAKIRQGAPV